MTPPTGWRHGLSAFGDIGYPPDFANFAWVDAAAPKGGRMVFAPPSWVFNQNPLTFNTLNSFVLKGDAPPRMELVFASLMVRALDEPDAVYGLAAENVEIAEGGALYRFRLRPGLTFHDGSPLTAADVAFSLTTLKDKGHPLIAQAIRAMASAEAEDERTVAVRFTEARTRQTPLVVAGLPIFSRAYHAENDFEAAGLTPPLGSGPYKVGRVDPGRFIEYERVADWWGTDLPTARGQFNFDVVRVEFYRDRQVGFEALKKGDVTFREEHVSRTWATEYDFPALKDGRVVRESLPDDEASGTQGWYFNLRRPIFADVRTRAAIGLCFDFAWTNKTLFYGLYTRTESFFQKSPMMASGLPQGEELALLEPWRGKVPDAVFGEPWTAPDSDGSGQDRANLRRASDLLAAAGWKRDGRRLVDAEGRQLAFEFLDNDPSFGRILQPYIRNLALVGIGARERVVDASQYEARLNGFDFDVTGRRFSISETPGEELRQSFSSEAANRDGSRNLSGIADPAVDALVEAVIAAPTRARLTTAARALDRVLRVLQPWVPNWYNSTHNVAYWDMFGHPPAPPRYGFPVETTWWFDEARAEKIGRPNG